MRILTETSKDLVFGDNYNDTPWTRFERTEGGKMRVDARFDPELSKENVEQLRVWLKTTKGMPV